MVYVHTLVLFLSWFFIFEFGFARDSITTTQFLRDPETLESSNKFFIFGFFSPIKSTNRYVGIWYSKQESDKLEVVWVANRENPISDSSGVFKISEDGNLQLLDGKNKVFWSSNVSRQGNNLVLQLLNTGNLVLRPNTSETTIWQSFEHPTDTFLPSMKFTLDESARNIYYTGYDLSLRLASSELAKTNQQLQGKPRKRKIILFGMAVIGIATASVWRWMCQRNGMRVRSKESSLQNSKPKGSTSEVEVGDLPVFGLKKLAIATDNFQEINKLGRGGFGIVYKGKLEDGQEIAVKRLSKASGQGLQEFMNEVLVISKLQHRNLVKLLGCCVEGEEKMLVYEYMPNKSLDALLFDPTNQKILDWKKRFNIILGICRGLLYLHRDSRLRIIHRDLKASNILLDGNLNPKISDFGTARIFGGNQDQGDTKRIVGTYGYMSPEYAMEGRFSEKSDVFSFGVLLLEVVSGRRNSSFKHEDSLSLLGHAWILWNEDNILSLIDPTISESTFHAEILKCIQLGLLCVQEIPEDRPSVSTVVAMIESEVTDLPLPSQPGFTQRRIATQNEAQPNQEYCSVDRVSITVLSGR